MIEGRSSSFGILPLPLTRVWRPTPAWLLPSSGLIGRTVDPADVGRRPLPRKAVEESQVGRTGDFIFFLIVFFTTMTRPVVMSNTRFPGEPAGAAFRAGSEGLTDFASDALVGRRRSLDGARTTTFFFFFFLLAVLSLMSSPPSLLARLPPSLPPTLRVVSGALSANADMLIPSSNFLGFVSLLPSSPPPPPPLLCIMAAESN